MFNKLKFAFVSIMAAGLLFCISNASYAYDRGGEWPPTEGGTVIFQVTAMGSPIGDAEVSVGDASGTTGQNGNTVFTVESGSHTASVEDHHGNTDSKEIYVHSGEIIQVTFDLGAAGRPASGSH